MHKPGQQRIRVNKGHFTGKENGMDVYFICPGLKGRQAAVAFNKLVSEVLPDLKTSFSLEENSENTNWIASAPSQYEGAKLAVVCVSPENLHSILLSFETGRVVDSVGMSRIVVLLAGLLPEELIVPYSLFDRIPKTKEAMAHLFQELNSSLGESSTHLSQINARLEKRWPQFELQIDRVRKMEISSSALSHHVMNEEVIRGALAIAEQAISKVRMKTPKAETGTGSMTPSSYHEAKKIALDSFQRQYFIEAFIQSNGRIVVAAEIIGIPVASLRRMMKELRIDPREYGIIDTPEIPPEK